ncbi:MAG: hypothetical protein H0A75_00255 [Candidatus Methanofishera endochildressiae]|uniref:DNA primase/polymerase bifunctional N-terminal domain-containing protein n=1 Tax=Candidatus Methanofishera endochildressiae TaxID=2738884 RepID=A0A7Z0SEH6_9GAMM|nr:hypothetical protein [Candidatus Methanofishera endochildressiae]
MGWVLGEKDLVVDVDISPDAGGRVSFMELEKDIGAKLQKTVKTPSGFHCYLQYEEDEVKLHKTLKEYPASNSLPKAASAPSPGASFALMGGR